MTARVPFTLAILCTIVLYTWLLQPRGVPVVIPALVVLLGGAWSAITSGRWGLSLKAFAPACRAAALFTGPAALAVLAAGLALGTLHDEAWGLRDFAILVVWGGAQQWLLQTVVLREAQQLTSPRRSVVISALLFAIVHLPNPFLTLMTFAGALGWCAIFVRYPNVIPLAVSHAVSTMAVLYAFDDSVTGRLRIGYAYLMFDQ
jgi:membrane protease YdiL (CAAX protease family)